MQAVKGGNGGHTKRDEVRTVSNTTKNYAPNGAPALSPAPAPPELPAPDPAHQRRQELVSSSKSGASEYPDHIALGRASGEGEACIQDPSGVSRPSSITQPRGTYRLERRVLATAQEPGSEVQEETQGGAGERPPTSGGSEARDEARRASMQPRRARRSRRHAMSVREECRRRKGEA
jgi:hypothetical protein